jgi:hypothetical protein
MTHYACPKCKCEFDLPASIPERALAEFAANWRAHGARSFWPFRIAYGLDLKTLKALAYHIPRERSRCHRCNKPLAAEVPVCENCRSLNLDW